MKPLSSLSAACALAVGAPLVHAGTPTLPDFGSAVFDNPTAIDNAYFPLVPGTVFTYEADIPDGEGGFEAVRITETVTFDTVVINGVESRVVNVLEWEDGLLVEDTDDWYAQDNAGNVWYMGEFATDFEYDDDDNLIGTSHPGSWVAGENGASAGYIMPAAPFVGQHYYQEFAPGDGAIDEATVTSLTGMVSTGLGDFEDVLIALETTALEPDAFENKLYAPGVGLVLIQEGTDEFGMDPEALIPLVSVEVIPEPGSAGLLALAGGLLLRRRRGGA